MAKSQAQNFVLEGFRAFVLNGDIVMSVTSIRKTKRLWAHFVWLAKTRASGATQRLWISRLAMMETKYGKFSNFSPVL